MSKSYPLIRVGKNGKATHRSDDGEPHCVVKTAHRPRGATISMVASAARKQVRSRTTGIADSNGFNP
jgi:hypothetical protein